MGPWNGGRYRQVVAIRRWSLAQVWLYYKIVHLFVENVEDGVGEDVDSVRARRVAVDHGGDVVGQEPGPSHCLVVVFGGFKDGVEGKKTAGCHTCNLICDNNSECLNNIENLLPKTVQRWQLYFCICSESVCVSHVFKL